MRLFSCQEVEGMVVELQLGAKAAKTVIIIQSGVSTYNCETTAYFGQDARSLCRCVFQHSTSLNFFQIRNAE